MGRAQGVQERCRRARQLSDLRDIQKEQIVPIKPTAAKPTKRTVLKWPTPAVVAAQRKAVRLAASKVPLTSSADTKIFPHSLHAWNHA